MRRLDGALGLVALAAPFACLAFALGACGDKTDPVGSGDKVTVDVDATQAPPTSPVPSADDASTAADDSSSSSASPGPFGYGTTSLDGYAPLSVCAKCNCPSGSFCFGGATGNTTFSGTCNHLDAGPDGPVALEVGCLPFPAACATTATCACVLQWLAPQTSCYLTCTPMGAFAAYCPDPSAPATDY